MIGQTTISRNLIKLDWFFFLHIIEHSKIDKINTNQSKKINRSNLINLHFDDSTCL